jgi:hypothetical protein
VTATTTYRIPRLPAAARKAGATTIKRCSRAIFSVGFELEGSDFDAPGKGAAVRDALARTFGVAAVEWGGRQARARSTCSAPCPIRADLDERKRPRGSRLGASCVTRRAG